MTPKSIFVIGLLLLGPAFVQYKMGESQWAKADRLSRQLERGDAPQASSNADVADPPTTLSALQHFGWATLFVLISSGCTIYTFVVHLDVFGRRKLPTSLGHRSRPIDIAKLKRSEASNLFAKSAPLLEAGFECLGYVETTVIGRRWRQALFMAPNGLGMVTIELGNPKARLVAIGVLENGICFSLSSSGEKETIDGTENGIPLMISSFPDATPTEIIEGFEQLKRLLSEQASVVAIDPAAALGLLHYRMQLKAWWMMYTGFSPITPEPLPSVDEIIQYRGTKPVFCWAGDQV